MFGRSKGEQGKKIKYKDFIKLYAQKMNCSEQEAERFLTGFIDTLYDGLKNIQPVTIEHLGSFYIAEKRESRIFKFNPAQKLKAILGWSSSFKGDI
jgi:DNA-binding protein HU-beta